MCTGAADQLLHQAAVSFLETMIKHMHASNSLDVFRSNIERFSCLFQAVEEPIILLIFEDIAMLPLDGYAR